MSRIRTYRQLSDAETRTINELKDLESSIAARIRTVITDHPAADRVLIEQAAHLYREAFQNLIRAVARPNSDLDVLIRQLRGSGEPEIPLVVEESDQPVAWASPDD